MNDIDDYLLKGQADRLKARVAKLQRWIARSPKGEKRDDLRAELEDIQGSLARAEAELEGRANRRLERKLAKVYVPKTEEPKPGPIGNDVDAWIAWVDSVGGEWGTMDDIRPI